MDTGKAWQRHGKYIHGNDMGNDMGNGMAKTWQTHGKDMAKAWQQHGHYTVAWQRHGKDMANTRQTQFPHMAETCLPCRCHEFVAMYLPLTCGCLVFAMLV